MLLLFYFGKLYFIQRIMNQKVEEKLSKKLDCIIILYGCCSFFQMSHALFINVLI